MPDFDLVVGADTRPAEQKLNELENLFNRKFKGGINSRSFTRPLGEISGKASEFQKSIDASNARVLAFGASAGSIYALKTAFEKLVSTTVEVEKSLVDINAIFGLGSSSLKTFSANLFNVANQTGETFKDATEAAVLFARQGLSVEETLKRTAAALTLSKISGLDFADSVTSITSILNGFSKEALDAATVLDRLTAVDSQFAVSAGTLAEALKRVGSSAEDANVTFNQTISLITAAAQITGRTGGVIGNTFKTIFSKVQRPEVLDQLEQVGVAVKDVNGKILPTMTILNNLSKAYQGLTSSQKSFVSQAVGGLYQINVLKAVLGDMGSQFSIVGRAQMAVANSTGIVQRRMDALNSTMAAGILRTMNDLTQATSNVSNVMVGSMVRGSTSQLSSALQMISRNTDTNNKSVQAQSLQGFFKGLGNMLSGPGLQIITTIFAKLISKLEQFVKESYHDILGTNAAAKERVAIEEQVINWLSKENEMVHEILAGTLSINAARERYLSEFNHGVTGYNIASTMAQPISSYVMEKGLTSTKVPNAYDPIADALYRENIATGGHARLDSHPSLVTASNPYGLVAIDTRTQKSAADAIQQHKMHGQPLGAIKKNWTDHSGFVPNLAVGDSMANSIALGMASLSMFGSVNQNIGEWISKYPTLAKAFASTTDLEIAKKRELIAEYDKVVKTFVTANGKIQQNFGGVTFSSAAQLGAHPLSQDINNLRQAIQKSDQERLQRRNNLSNIGLRGAISASFAGGLAAQYGSNLSPTAGASIDQLQTGVTEAFQSLMALPNTLGKGLAAGFVAGGVFNSLDTFSKKLEDAQASYEMQLDKDKSLMETLTGLIQTISNLNGMFLDTSVSQEDITKANQNYVSTLAKLSQLQGGGDLVSRIMATASPQGQMDIIGQFQMQKANEMSASAALMGSQENFAKYSTMFNRNVGYSYSNDFDKGSVQALVADTAAAAISSLSDEMRNALMGQLGNRGAFGVLANQIPLVQKINQTGGSAAATQLIQTIGNQMMFSKLQNSPDMQQAIDTARKNAQAAQISLDNAVRYQQFLQKLFLNQGAANVQNALNLRSYGISSAINAQLAGINLAQQGAGLFGETHGARATAYYNYQNSVAEEKANYDKSQARINIEANTFIADSMRKMGGYVDEYLRNSMSSNPTLAGQKAQELGDYSKQFIQGVNTGFQSVYSQSGGDVFNKFRGANGQFDINAFASAIANSSGVSNATIRGNIQSFMQSNPDEKFLESLNDYTKQGLDATQTTKQVITEKFNEMISQLAKADFEQQVNYLGGIRDLLDRQSRRASERKLIRGETLMNNANLPPEMQARGAAMVMDYYKENGFALDNSNPDAMRARSIFLQNQTLYMQNESARLEGQLSGLGAGTAIQTLQGGPVGGYMQAALTQANARWGFTNPDNSNPLANYNGVPINDKATQDALNAIQKDQDSFATILNKFPDAIQDTVNKLNAAYEAISGARSNLNSVTSQGQTDIESSYKKLMSDMDVYFSQAGQLNQGGATGWKGKAEELAGPIMQAIVTGLATALFSKMGGGALRGLSRFFGGKKIGRIRLEHENVPIAEELPTSVPGVPKAGGLVREGAAAGESGGIPSIAATAAKESSSARPFTPIGGQYKIQGRFASRAQYMAYLRAQGKQEYEQVVQKIRLGQKVDLGAQLRKHVVGLDRLKGQDKDVIRGVLNKLGYKAPSEQAYGKMVLAEKAAREKMVSYETGQPHGPYQLPEEPKGGQSILQKSAGVLEKELNATGAPSALTGGIKGVGKLFTSELGATLSFRNWGALSKLGKLGKVGGVAAVGLSGLNLYQDLKGAQTWQDYVGAGGNFANAMLNFAGPVGRIGSAVNWGAKWAVGKAEDIATMNTQSKADMQYVAMEEHFLPQLRKLNQHFHHPEKEKVAQLQDQQKQLVDALHNLNDSVKAAHANDTGKENGAIITMGNITVVSSTWRDALDKINIAMEKQYNELEAKIEKLEKPNNPPKVLASR